MTGNMSRKEFLTRLGFASLAAALNPTVLEGLTGCATQDSEKRIYPDSSPHEPRSLYAPYWYVDESTESFVEIKNNLSSPLIITPLLSPNSGPPIRLDDVKIAPLATIRLGLKPKLSQVRRTEGRPQHAPRWGDGSRPDSLLGSIQLIPVSPKNAVAKAASAWVLTENPKERLGVVTTFEDPADLINPAAQQGLWWLPSQDAKAYFSFQNAAATPLHLQIDLLGSGRTLTTQFVHLEGSASHFLDIGDALGTDNPPTMGGIRVSTICGDSAQPVRSFVVGRGRIIDDKLGLASPLMLHESLGDVLAPKRSELHAPAAYFGALDRLVSHTTAFLHPHLLLWNTRNHEITVEVQIYGKDLRGADSYSRLQPITLPPQSGTQVDLQKQREELHLQLSDGVAGLRLIHNGAPADVVAELLNVDQSGRFAYYDAIRGRAFHLADRQIAVSFNLAHRNQSFLILKNTTDASQNARVILDYDDGRQHYDVNLPELPPQQVHVVDIKRIRDLQTPDRNGRVLPRAVDTGGAAIFSGHGAIVISDPTFKFASPPTQPAAGPADPDPPDGDIDRPFFAPSCGRGGVRDCSCPPPSFRTAKIWINAFLPHDIPGQTVPDPRSPGLTMLKPACIPPLTSDLHFCYETDQRSFDSNIHALSRMHSEITVDVETGLALSQWHNCDCTYEFFCETGVLNCSQKASTSMMNFPAVISGSDGVITVLLDGAAADPCVLIASIFGFIKYRGRFIINVPSRSVEFVGEISQYPAYEAYATADDGAGSPLFQVGPVPGVTGCDIPSAPLRSQTGSTFI